MKILSITAGAANMYCGSCLRDNALAGELMRQRHDVVLVPLYTPTRKMSPMSVKTAYFLAESIYTFSRNRRFFRGHFGELSACSIRLA